MSRLLTLGAGGGDAAGGIKTSLISFWELEEASGTRTDSHGANNLTDNNTVTQAVGKVGNAAQFTAANSEWLDRANEAGLQPGVDFTFTFWLYLDSIIASHSIINKDANAAGNRQFALLTLPDSLNFFVFDSSTGNVSVASAAVSTATWYFFVCWFDNSDKKAYLSRDDETPRVSGGVLTNGVNTTGTVALEFGRRSFDGLHHDGRIDQVGYWSRLLTATERTFLYNSGNGRAYSEL